MILGADGKVAVEVVLRARVAVTVIKSGDYFTAYALTDNGEQGPIQFEATSRDPQRAAAFALAEMAQAFGA